MTSHIKNALITSATVLVVIYVARQISMTAPLVDKALRG